MSEILGIDLWIKRDDLTGFALGGNKGRKLEFLMAEAKRMGADTVVTCGAAQSNFVRQLGAACAMLGMRCVAAVMGLPYAEVHGVPAHQGSVKGGNVTLDQLLGVDLRFFPDGDWEELVREAEDLALEEEALARKVYRIPIGGSSAIGAYAFVEAALEVPGFDVVVTPCSSGSTHAGLAYGFHKSATRVVGVSCDPEPEIMEDLVRLVRELDAVTGQGKGMTEADLDLRLDWAGEAYGVPSPAGQSALTLLAQTEGVFLDPVYTAKAFSGLIDLAQAKELRGKVLFWHTGGTPALFAE
jgi:D-cysteine desulfhydrase/L-cysteate sulfo-lyase